jgi:5-methylcytosine-specific restriction endonuclease McrA
MPTEVPIYYNGAESLYVTRLSRAGYRSFLVIDHVLSLRNGGTNHPDNLQTLCDCCNAAKSGLVDSKFVRAA